MADDNRPLKYMRYAIGEIILVVIGILIALYINNWNEKRKEREKFDQILVEVEKELISNIEEARRILDFYYEVDSLSNIFFFDSLTVENYRDEKNLKICELGLSFENMECEEDAYNKLAQYSENIDKTQDSAITGLKNLYGLTRTGINQFQDDIVQCSDDIYKHHMNYSWFADSFEHKYMEAYFEHIATDQLHRNKISYFNLCKGDLVRSLEQFDIKGRNIYKRIHSYLAKNYPNHSEPVRFKYDANDFKHLVGTYKAIWSSTNNFFQIDSTIISIENDSLFYTPYLKNRTNTRREIIPIGKSYFRTEHGRGYYQVIYDDKDEVERVDFSLGQNCIKQKKMR